jgi:hypothetical protein
MPVILLAPEGNEITDETTKPPCVIEGMEYLPDHRGRYYCPHKCGSPNYPQPHWSTEKGFAGHLAKCKGKPENVGTWTPPPKPAAKFYGFCECGEMIFEGDSVGMVADHEQIECYACWLAGVLQDAHLDSAGLKLPAITLEG